MENGSPTDQSMRNLMVGVAKQRKRQLGSRELPIIDAAYVRNDDDDVDNMISYAKELGKKFNYNGKKDYDKIFFNCGDFARDMMGRGGFSTPYTSIPRNAVTVLQSMPGNGSVRYVPASKDERPYHEKDGPKEFFEYNRSWFYK